MLDDLDMRIIHELQGDARQSSRKIGKKLGIAHTTIQRRIKELTKHNILHIVALPNWVALGYQVWAMIGLTTKHGRSKYVAQELLKYPTCYTISETLGQFDVIFGARFKSMEELTQFVTEELPGIKEIEKSVTYLFIRPHRYYDFEWAYGNNNNASPEISKKSVRLPRSKKSA